MPLSDAATQLLVDLRKRVPKGAEWVFPAADGFARRDVKDAWASLCRTANIKGARLHDLRHTYASVLASAGLSLPIIGQLLGHTTPTTTARYAHLFDDPLRAATQRASQIIIGKPATEIVPLPVRQMSARMSKREREEAKRQLEAEHLKQAFGGKVSAEQLDELGLKLMEPISPAMEFCVQQLKGVSPDDPQYETKSNQAIIDLVASDVPLDPLTRSRLAGELRRLYFPNEVRDRRKKQRWQNAMIEDVKHHLLSCGVCKRAWEAEDKIIETIGQAFGIKSVEAWRQRIKRARRTKT